MGMFLAITAIHESDRLRIFSSVESYFEKAGVPIASVTNGVKVEERTDALVFDQTPGWTVILWPPYFNIHDFPLAKSVAADLGTMVSSLHIYDGDYWEHLFQNGQESLHYFSSRPGYWTEEGQESPAYEPNPERMCRALSIEPQSVEGYLVDVDSVDPGTLAYEGDQFEIDDIWVMADFWNKLGIVYPEVEDYREVWRLDQSFSTRLPSD